MVMGGKNVFPSEKTERPISFLDNGIASLAPGATVSSIIGSFARVKEVFPELVFGGNVSYKSTQGKEYEEVLVLDLRHVVGAMNLDRKTIHDVAKQLEDIKTEISHIGTGFRKPHVLTQDITAYREEREQFFKQVQAKKEDAEQPLSP